VKLRHAGLIWRVAAEERERFPGAYGRLFDALNGNEHAAEALRRTRRKKVFRQQAPGDPNSDAYLKVYDRRGIGTFLAPPALREARGMQFLPSLGIAVPRVVAAGVSSALGLRRRSALVSVTPARFRHFGAHAHRVFDLAQGSRSTLLEDLGQLHALLRRMHDASFFHGDLNLGNVLFDPMAREFCFVDFHRSTSGVRRNTRERTADLSKLREFFEQHVSWPEWEPLLRKQYCAGDASLADLVLRDWEEVRRERAARKVAGTVRNALAGEHHFVRQVTVGATVTYARQAGIDAEALVELARSGGGGRVCLLGVYEGVRSGREAWSETVRRAAAGEPGAMPLAWVELEGAPGARRAVLLGLEGEEPRYSLRRVFSLRRFAESEPAAGPPRT
jgi:tRNA A-37 threonylcarbamoyl transferase component Bud32